MTDPARPRRPLRRADIERIDAARRDAREALAGRITDARAGLTPQHLVAMWKTRQLRRLGDVQVAMAMGAARNRNWLAAGAALAVALPLLWLARARRRNDPAEQGDGDRH